MLLPTTTTNADAQRKMDLFYHTAQSINNNSMLQPFDPQGVVCTCFVLNFRANISLASLAAQIWFCLEAPKFEFYKVALCRRGLRRKRRRRRKKDCPPLFRGWKFLQNLMILNSVIPPLSLLPFARVQSMKFGSFLLILPIFRTTTP